MILVIGNSGGRRRLGIHAAVIAIKMIVIPQIFVEGGY